MIRAFLLWAVMLVGLPIAAPAQTFSIPEVPEVSVTVEPAAARTSGWYVQGQIVLTVRVASKHPFEELDFKLPKFAKAHVIELVRPRTRIVRSYAGSGTVLEAVLAVFPREPGQFEIPSVRASGMVIGDEGEEVRFEDATEPITLEVAGIDPAFDGAWWMVSPRVEISERWSKPLDQARIGDILRREVSVVVFGVTAERIRLPEHRRTATSRMVEVETTSRTEISGDGVIGHVTRAWDLKIETGRTAYVSAYGVSYWNPLTHETEKATVGGRVIEPLPADTAAIAERLIAEARAAHDGYRSMAAGLAAVVVLAVLLVIAAIVFAALPTRADRKLARVCASSPSAEALYRAVEEWIVGSGFETGTFEDARHLAGVPLFGAASEPADARALCGDLLRRARYRRLKELRAWFWRRVEDLIGRRTALPPDTL